MIWGFKTIEEDPILDLASSSNRKLDLHSFSRLIESLNQDKASSHLVSQDVELFFAFLLGMIMYPNYAISNKTYSFDKEAMIRNGIRPSNEWSFLVHGDQGSVDVLLYPTRYLAFSWLADRISGVIGYFASHVDNVRSFLCCDDE